MAESRVHKSFLNARVNLIFYVISLFFSFFSRKIFLEQLGVDFIGLTSTISNLLQFLNLAELGIGTAVGVVLYKPLFSNNKNEINEIISVFGYLYRKIGFFIFIGGIIISLFIPFFFEKADFSFGLIYFTFYSFLASTLIGYFANYKQTLLGADQKNYVVTAYFQISNLCKSVIQIILAYYTHNLYYWVIIELLFAILYSIILNYKIKKVYPWLNSNKVKGKELSSNYPLIMRYSKQLFIHRIGSLVQFQVQPILIYAFVSLKVVAFYGNYILIIEKLSLVVKSVLDSTSAGVGSLIAEGEKNKITQIFWQLISIRFFIAGILTFSIYHLINPFITLWLDESYVLDDTTLIIILSSTFITQTRGTVDQFNQGYGLFNDLWAPITESVLSLSIALFAGMQWGLQGILMGNVISSFIIVVLWKPYFLFSQGFKDSIAKYWREVIKILILISLTFFLSHIIISNITICNPSESYTKWISYSIVICSIFIIIEFSVMFMFIRGFQAFSYRMFHLIISKFKK